MYKGPQAWVLKTMGCVYSKKNLSDHSVRVFRVYNVDDQGLELNPGKIEVGDTDLILYQKGKEPIRWPLRCLRRYGFDAELFSFESGRRCLTGPGIYAFKCRHAEALFNLVQECILRAGQEEQNRALLGSTSRLHSRPGSIVEAPESNGILMTSRNHVMTGNGLRLYVNGSTFPDNMHNYINTGPSDTLSPQMIDAAADNTVSLLEAADLSMPPQESAVNYAVLDLSKSSENLCDESSMGKRNESRTELDMNPDGNGNYADSDVFADLDNGGQPNYVNIRMESIPQSETMPTTSKPKIVDRNYANLSLNANLTPPRSHSSEIRKVTYIQLDLNRSSDNLSCGGCASPTSPLSFSSFPESPGKRTESYALIDFNKTAALSNSAKVTTDEDDGLRKTRHNSTISDF